MTEKVPPEPTVCGCCGAVLVSATFVDDKYGGEWKVDQEKHFDIIRANKTYDVEWSSYFGGSNELIEDESERNIKTHLPICKKCFIIICNESPTLGKVFKIDNKFIL